MPNKMILLLLVVLCALQACKSGSGASHNKAAELPLQVVFRNTLTNLPQGCHVFNSVEDLQKLKDENVIAALSKRDFSKETLLMIVQAQRSSGGFNTDVLKITETKSKMTIDYRETAPAPDVITISAITYPTIAFVVPKTKKKIAFTLQK